ncbi:hypothetical protein E6O75_ATG06573 [Venturia nashicola]|uniref:Uncharacterized protein n=1 Tax=Venturia nashicola TaxID=86259 RepID=A0A4Z1NR33_9PEZI|nr:hypothetical protein E6O75_ATG06573 [Venturia nashicola]
MDKTRQPLRSWLRNEPEIKERSAMASSEHTATTPVDARNSLVESPRDTEISDTTLAPTTMTSDPPIPSFNYMFEGEEESSDDELPDPTKCDSKFLRFEDLRVKERGNYFEASFTQAMHGSLVDDARIACEFLQRETDAEAASLHSSMTAGIALASTSIVHLPAATREERVLGAPVIGYSWSTKTTPTPSEIAKTKSAGQSLCRIVKGPFEVELL